MAHLIDKSAVVAEIEREKAQWRICKSSEAKYRLEMLDDISDFVDTIKVKEVDLDYIKEELDRLIRIHKPDGDFGWGTLYNVATHFFELGLKVAQKGE